MHHRFWSCSHSQWFWKLVRSATGALVATPPDLDYSQTALANWLLYWLTTARQEERSLMLQAVYGLWLARNEARGGKLIKSPQEVTNSVLGFVKEWEEAHLQRQANVRAPAVKERWKPPDEGWIKINCDSALSKANELGGGGIVMLDHNGVYLGGASHSFKSVSDPQLAELLACKEGLILAEESGVAKVHVELDCQAAVSLLNSTDLCLALNGPIVQGIKLKLGAFQEVKFSWAPRSANGAAHELAKVGLSVDGSMKWAMTAPDCILAIIASDF